MASVDVNTFIIADSIGKDVPQWGSVWS